MWHPKISLVLRSSTAAGFVLASCAVAPSVTAQEPASPAGHTPTEWPSPRTVAAHAESVEQHRRQREERLRQPESWLTLAGLHWLHPGSNTLGSDAANDIVLPDSAPPFVGDIVFETAADGSTAVFRPVGASTASGTDGASIRVDGAAPPAESLLVTDSAGEPTMVEAGDVVFYLIQRLDRTAVRVKDRKSPALLEFDGLDYYPPSWRWRIEGEFVPYEEGKEIAIPSVLGGADPAPIPGAVVFDLDGETYRLEALPGGDANELFLVFGDQTNADTTYGGGRFLYATVQAEDLESRAPVVLDFNKAYNPPCVFTPWATCPLPPPENRLGMRVEAGEKMYEGGVGH